MLIRDPRFSSTGHVFDRQQVGSQRELVPGGGDQRPAIAPGPPTEQLYEAFRFSLNRKMLLFTATVPVDDPSPDLLPDLRLVAISRGSQATGSR